MIDIIAIDGPAGSGKSTVAKLIARKLSFTYVDTGAMYRALTLKAIREKINLKDECELAKLLQRINLDIKNNDNGELVVFLDDEDVTGLIRTPELTTKVSYLARAEGVRQEMVKLQRKIASRGKCVFEGRDITTVVFPEAKHKFYLEASLKERASRRFKELMGGQQGLSLEKVEKDINTRDEQDKKRKYGPLRKADDAVCIDTTNMGIEEVVSKVCSYIS